MLDELASDIDEALMNIEEMVMMDDPFFDGSDVKYINFPQGEMVVLPVFADGGRSDKEDPAYVNIRCWVISEHSWGFDVLTEEETVVFSYKHKDDVTVSMVQDMIDECIESEIAEDFVYYIDFEYLSERVNTSPRAVLIATLLAPVLNKLYEN